MREQALAVWREALRARDEEGQPTTQAVQIANRLLEYTDGPPVQKQEHSGGVEIVWRTPEAFKP